MHARVRRTGARLPFAYGTKGELMNERHRRRESRSENRAMTRSAVYVGGAMPNTYVPVECIPRGFFPPVPERAITRKQHACCHEQPA